jgi:LysM repeat protein
MLRYTLTIFAFLLASNFLLAQALTPYFNYTVTDNDKTLWSISQKHGVSLDEVKVLNQKTDDKVLPGQVLKIPKHTPKDPDFIIHTVEKEDKNLYRIGLKYKVTTEELMLLNNKKSSTIRRGEQLKIPKNGQYIIHIVSETDKSLWGICQIYGVEVEDVKKINHKKNNSIRKGDRLAIPKEHQIATTSEISETVTVPPINGNKEGVKAAYDIEANYWRFPYHNRKELHIFPSIKTGFSNYYKLSPVEYAAFFQNSKDYAPNKEQKDRYFYSVEKPFVKSLDNENSRYLSLKEKELLGVKDGYTYDFITLIEVDSVNHSFKILPIFLVKDAFGSVVSSTEKGSFVCCADPFPLALYKKTKEKEITTFSTLITPSIIKHTKIVKVLKGENVLQTNSTISIFQLKTDAVPSLIDSEEYSNGKKTRSFSNTKRRQELGY